MMSKLHSRSISVVPLRLCAFAREKFTQRRKGAKKTKLLLLGLAALLSVSLFGCQSAKPKAAAHEAKRYELNGKVVSVDKAKKEVTISHEDIPDYMPGMTMPFPLKDEWAFDVLAPGNKVSATLVVDENSFWLEGIVVSAAAGDTPANGTEETKADPKVGQQVPGFSLVNQDGKRINLKQYRGKVLLLTFIYTRCPLPDYCTLMSTNFASLDKQMQAQPEIVSRTHLLSVTIDPEYDTPQVLKSYGGAHTGNYVQERFAHWEFATGKPQEIKQIAEFFGLTYFTENKQITHSLRTAVIAPDGKLYKLYYGNGWNTADVYRDVQELLGQNGK